MRWLRGWTKIRAKMREKRAHKMRQGVESKWQCQHSSDVSAITSRRCLVLPKNVRHNNTKCGHWGFLTPLFFHFSFSSCEWNILFEQVRLFREKFQWKNIKRFCICVGCKNKKPGAGKRMKKMRMLTHWTQNPVFNFTTVPYKTNFYF